MGDDDQDGPNVVKFPYRPEAEGPTLFRPVNWGKDSPLDSFVSSLMIGLSHKPTSAPIRALFDYRNERNARHAILFALKVAQDAGFYIEHRQHDPYHGTSNTVVVLDKFTKIF